MKPNPLFTALGATVPIAAATGLFLSSETQFPRTEIERQKQHADSVRNSWLLAGGSAGLGLLLGGLDHPGTIGRGLLYGSALYLAVTVLPSLATAEPKVGPR